MNVKSIEPDVRAWADNQLTNNEINIAREQDSIDSRIDTALSKEPSKQGGNGSGRPDTQLIISNGAYDIPVIIEYKGTKGFLENIPKKTNLVKLKNDDNSYDYKNSISKYGVNGAAYYSSIILRHTDYREVLSVGVNGYDDPGTNNRNYEIKAYISNQENPDVPIFIGQYSDMSFLFKNNQVNLMKKIEDSQVEPEELHQKAILDDSRLDEVLKNLNNHLREESRIRAGQRIFVVAACIMASLGIKDSDGKYLVSPLEISELEGISSEDEENETDGARINRKVKSFLKKKKLPKEKQDQIDNALKQVLLFSNLSVKDDKLNISPLKSAYIEIKNNLIPAYEMAGTLDFTGKLFNVMNEWVDVPDGDSNDVVLTPRYITNLMAKLTDVDMNSYVWDWALGSGGFLISSMNIMLADARKREKSPAKLSQKIIDIKSKQLLGIEKLSDIYILAILNMILMGDGSSNIANENSLKDFDGKYIYSNEDSNENKKFPANVLLLNPPYSAEGNGMIFMESALKKMSGGKAAIIVQDTAGNGKATDINKRILENNRLIASIKMPSDIFSSGVQTSIYLFEVNKKHDKNDIVKFINFDEDGYKRNFRRRAKHHLVDSGTAKERYDDLVKTVYNGISNSKYLQNNENYIEDYIDPNSGNDWNFEYHETLDSVPDQKDFYNTLSEYIQSKINDKLGGK